MIIFYSWQKDLPNNTNWTFIETALKKAIRNIRNDDSIKVEPVIDRDTLGVPGSPEIPKTVLSKIDKCDVFLCDLSIINNGSKFKATPNPNVLFELGYALRKFNDSDSLDWENIIMVMNTAFGEINKLPFDLDKRRVITYSISENTDDKATERTILEKKLEGAIRAIINKMPQEEIIVAKDKTLSQFEELKKKQDFESKRSRWLHSEQGFNDLIASVSKLFHLIKQKYKEVKSSFPEIEFKRKSGENLIELNYRKFSLTICLGRNSNNYRNTPNQYRLSIVFCEKVNQIVNIKLNRLCEPLFFSPNLDESDEIIWFDKKNNILRIDDLCNKSFNILANELKKYNNLQDIPYYKMESNHYEENNTDEDEFDNYNSYSNGW